MDHSEGAHDDSKNMPDEIKKVVKDAIENLSTTVDDESETGAPGKYDDVRANHWTNKVCEQCMEKLVAKSKPYKYVVTCLIMRRNGAGIHVCSSALWDNDTDNVVCEVFDTNKHLYAYVTVYWVSI